MSVEFINPSQSDSEFIFQLRNAADVRNFAQNSEIIPNESHKAWFQDRILVSKEQPFWVLTHNGDRIGYVRFDKGPMQIFFISIAISETFRGRGLGRVALNKSVSKFQSAFPFEKIGAVIHVENLASIRIFRNAGFRIQNQDSEFMHLEL
jgi:RimJ/RimL family protein N-acetyltransferase